MAGDRIVHVVNFVRALEPRDPQMDLVKPVVEQLRLGREYKLPTTWLLQYDTLIDERFLPLMRNVNPGDEIGAWWEIVQPQVEAAGLKWHGRYAWDWHCDAGFSVAYTQAEREKLVDVYFAKFKATFGYYPASIGSWLFDAHTLGYMADRYGVVAACNCKDQVGTDGYTMWGGYFNQAYYPSRVNSYMPAQTSAGAIPVPVFRMLGSDPIHQYDLFNFKRDMPGVPSDVVTLEPVYAWGGGDPAWVRWFFDAIYKTPCLAFAHTQAGQENPFGWEKIGPGLTDQMAELARRVQSGEIRAETMATTGRWFKSTFAQTPATAMIALDDWYGAKDKKTVWYDSAYYRTNLLWSGDRFIVRDIHRFDEKYAERHLTETCKTPACTYDTLPIVEGVVQKSVMALVSATGDAVKVGPPTVTEQGESLTICFEIVGVGRASLICSPKTMAWTLPAGVKLQLTWRSEGRSDATRVDARRVSFCHEGFNYVMDLSDGSASSNGIASPIEFVAEAGRLTFVLG